MRKTTLQRVYNSILNKPSEAYHKDLKKVYSSFSGIIIDNSIGNIENLQNFFDKIHNIVPKGTRILISHHNELWEPILSIATRLGLRKKVGIQNWVDQHDIQNILSTSNFKVTESYKRFFGITQITIAESIPAKKVKSRSVSIVVPAKNEAGNIANIVKSMPNFGKWQEIIFVEGGSKDDTWNEITKIAKKNKNVKAYKQKHTGKADAVLTGFTKARGEILIIYDADMTVSPNDLITFYNCLASGEYDFANGNRLVYPMERDAMRTLNKVANMWFGQAFSWILKTRFKDTLCGTKAIFKKDFIKFRKDYNSYFKSDPFGDFALIFTAVKNNLRIIEIPVKYKERVYGSTNISRLKHGLLLMKMTFKAFVEFKF